MVSEASHKGAGKRRKGLFSKAIISMAVLIALFALYWAGGRAVIAKSFNDIIMTSRESGHTVQPKAFTLSGFPLSFKGHMRALLLAAPQARAPWSLRTEALHLRAASINPFNWDMYHGGDARLDMRGPGGQRWLFDIRPFLLNGDVRLAYNGRVKSVMLNADKVRPQAVIGTEPPFRALDNVRTDLIDSGNDIDIELTLDNVFLSPKVWTPLQSVFGPRVERVTVKAKAESLSGFSQEDFEAWAPNAHLTSSDWLLKWNGFDLSGDFDLTSTAQGVSGDIRIMLEDEKAFFEALISSGLINSTQASLMKFALASRSKTATGQNEINLVLKNSQLSLFGQTIYKF